MRLTRIYLAQPLQAGKTAVLDAQASHHLQHVLRLQVGDPLLVFDGLGHEHQAKIVSCQKLVQVLIQQPVSTVSESPLHIHLAQAVSRGEKMDYTLQKAVELGVNAITPLFTERCGVKLAGERLQHKVAHWQKIIISACEQSGRSHIPQLHAPVSLQQFLAKTDNAGYEMLENKVGWAKRSLCAHQEIVPPSICKLVLHPHAAKSLKSVSPSQQTIHLLVGSEGGFSETEVELANHAGFTSICLGPRILRTETAALAAITVLQCLWGDLN